MSKRPRIQNGWARVTGVLNFLNSEWKEGWFRRNGFEACDKITRESATFGSHVHKIVETWLLREEIPSGYTEKEVLWATTLINWLSKNKATVVYINGKPAIEYEVKDEKLRLIGHLDALFNIDGENVLTDFKTTGEHRKEFPVQKAAYSKMLENYGVDVNKGLTLKIMMKQDTPEISVAWYEGLKQKYWKLFLNGYKFYRYMSGKDKVK